MSASPERAASAPAMGLAAALRERTSGLHVRAERTGIVREVLAGRASRHGYALLLRNLMPAYARMEEGLERHRLAPGVRAFAQPAVYRTGALAADLAALCGPAWSRSLGLGAQSLSFYDFSALADPEEFKAGYRAALDAAAHEIEDCAGVVEEAARAFELNIAVSSAVQDATARLGAS